MKNKNENWEKEFEKEFWSMNEDRKENIKSFIRQEKAKSYEEGYIDKFGDPPHFLEKKIKKIQSKDRQRFIEILEGLKEKEIEVDADEVVKGSLVGITSWNAHIRGINQKIQETIDQLKDEK